jgi:hypothetical protein
VEGCRAAAATRARPFPVRAGDGGVAGFGSVGGFLFSLGEASEGCIVGRLPFRGSSAVLLLGQAHGELLRLDIGGRSSGGGSRFQGDGLGVDGASGGASHGALCCCSAGPTRVSLLDREKSRRAWRCSAGRRGVGARGAARQGESVRNRDQARSHDTMRVDKS